MTTMEFWAGFTDDKIHVRRVDTGFGGYGNKETSVPTLFASKADAEKEYRDVRLVEVRIVKRKAPTP